MNKRQFRYTAQSHLALNNNPAHKFSLSYLLPLYGSQSCVTFIPKNACSSLRYSVAVANGLITQNDDAAWIHKNNHTYSLTTKEAAIAKYTFVILRCPYSRIYSAFIDKYVGLMGPAWKFSRKFLEAHRHRTIYETNFSQFIEILAKADPRSFDQHIRPQIDFLVYEKYDSFFAFENMAETISNMENTAGFTFYDTRKYLYHDVSSLQITSDYKGNASKLSILELLLLKQSGKRPAIEDMLDDCVVQNIKKIYSRDIELYKNVIGDSKLIAQFK